MTSFQHSTLYRRWFIDVDDKISRAETSGYVPVCENGQEVRRVVGTDGTTAVLMEIRKVERNLERFFTARKGMGEAVKARIIRLNSTIEEGAKIRGWHPAPTAKVQRFLCGFVSKGEFIKKYGRQNWDHLRRHFPDTIKRDGKRQYVTGEAVQDQAWLYVKRGNRYVRKFEA